MRLAIIGSRDYPDLDRVARFVNKLPAGTIVISGGARGPDSYAVGCARRRGLDTEVKRAEWDTLGRRAGMVRNEALVASADAVVAFWDGTSRGTAHAISTALRTKKSVRVCDPTGREIPHEELRKALHRQLRPKKRPAEKIDYDPAWERDKVSTTRTRMLRRWARARTHR